MLAYSGCRVGELVKLRVRDFRPTASTACSTSPARATRSAPRRCTSRRSSGWPPGSPSPASATIPPAALLPPPARPRPGQRRLPRPADDDRAVDKLIGRYVAALGLDANVTVHSLRVTALTTARERGSGHHRPPGFRRPRRPAHDAHLHSLPRSAQQDPGLPAAILEQSEHARRSRPDRRQAEHPGRPLAPRCRVRPPLRRPSLADGLHLPPGPHRRNRRLAQILVELESLVREHVPASRSPDMSSLTHTAPSGGTVFATSPTQSIVSHPQSQRGILGEFRLEP